MPPVHLQHHHRDHRVRHQLDLLGRRLLLGLEADLGQPSQLLLSGRHLEMAVLVVTLMEMRGRGRTNVLIPSGNRKTTTTRLVQDLRLQPSTVDYDDPLCPGR